MIRIIFEIPKDISSNNSYSFAKEVFNHFKQTLKTTVNITKFKLRYNYLIDNDILVFNNFINLYVNKIIDILVNSFRLFRYKNSSNTYCICIFDYLTIPNTDMTVSEFIRFIEYGDLTMMPYHWIHKSWEMTKQYFDI